MSDARLARLVRSGALLVASTIVGACALVGTADTAAGEPRILLSS